MSPLREVFSGALWVVAARWGMRTIGLVSTVLLARLLTPHDFGIVGMAMLVVGGIEVFGYTGMINYLIRHPNPQRGHFDTAFTLQLGMGLLLGGLLFVSAPYGAAFFGEPALELVIRCLALRPIIGGLENPGIMWFRKNMRFGKDFEFLVVNKLFSFVVTVGVAFALRNYWALVAGSLAGGLISMLQSYRMHPYRPRLSLSEVGVLWRYSAWVLVANVLDYMNSHLDKMIIGRAFTATEMGYYSIGSDLAATPVQEVIFPMTRVWEPAFAKLAGDPEALERTYRWLFSAVAIAAFSMSVGLALVAEDFVAILLGPRWQPAVPLMQILALASGLAAIVIPMSTVLWATRDLRIYVSLGVARLVLLLSAMLPAALWYGVNEVAMGRTAAMGAWLLLTLVVFERVVGLRPLTLVRSMVRPSLAVLAMAGTVLLMRDAAPAIPAVRLVLCMASGGLSFGVTLVALWALAGRPDAVERDVLGWCAGHARTLRGRWAG